MLPANGDTFEGGLGNRDQEEQGNGPADDRARDAADLEALIKAARTEAEVTFYCAQVEVVAKRVTEAFSTKYGIKAQYIRLPSSQLMQRYAAKAESGNIAADVVFNAGNAVGFAEEGLKKGWGESISTAGLPVLKSASSRQHATAGRRR